MPSDPAVQVATIGIATTFITTIGVVLVAVFNSRKERWTAADGGVEATLRERLSLRDEQNTELRDDVADLQSRLASALEEINEKHILMEEMRQEIVRLRGNRERKS